MPSWKVPRELANLPLFAADKILCEQFYDYSRRMAKNFPDLDIFLEVQKAHSYQIQQQAEGKKLWKSKIQGIGRWLRRAAGWGKAVLSSESRTPRRNLPPLDPEEVENGRAAYRKHKEKLVREGKWPGYRPEVKEEGDTYDDVPF